MKGIASVIPFFWFYVRGMDLRREQIELLAPAGSYEGFEAALGAGADAVYVGGTLFGARAYAKNFDQDELLKAIDTAHIYGKKLYLTVNTLLKNKELTEQLYDYLLPYYEEGLDAVIVQDWGVFSAIREMFPGLHIHASTQMTITGPEGMRFLEEQGASRVVTARELSLEEIFAMHQASSLEIEAFIHGALCYSYSGQCLMSSILGGRSGNRGRCAQPCRLPYEVSLPGKGYKGKKDTCPLSLKDISTIDILPQILHAGVTSLKIEGRMKQPGYTAGVTSIYRKYLDLLFEKGQENYQVLESDRQYLLDLFNRGGSCEGYYLMQNGPSMMAFSNEKKTGDIKPEIKKKKEKVMGILLLYQGEPVTLKITCRDIRISVSAGEVQSALKQPLEKERILAQMDKLGNTPFEWDRLDIQMDNNIFVPVKILNEVRRMALEELEQKIQCTYKRKTPKPYSFVKYHENVQKTENLPVYVSCEDVDTALALIKREGLKGMYLPFFAMETCLLPGLEKGLDMYLALPHMVRGSIPLDYLRKAKEWIDQGMKGFLVRNTEAFSILNEEGLANKCMLDHSMYTWNDEAVRFWDRQGVLGNTVPLELNEGEIRHRDNRKSEMLVYGRLPLMISAQCVRKNIYGCNHREDMVYLKDRYGKEFPCVCFCEPWKMKNTKASSPCYNIIYNSLPFGLLKDRERVKMLGVRSLRLAFTIEKPHEAATIFDEFKKVYGDGKDPSDQNYTRGHFKRGAE